MIETTDCRRNIVVKYVASNGQGTGNAIGDLSRARRHLSREIKRLQQERERGGKPG
ncbi:hypothetical protein [Streptomyces sp. AP-93]|uniref:hypothetical protein n=1 Tax=Streptomyces sp. AP-93 TaxID=2929048 RepID=UPI001FB00BF2|nr:hypothetical protein [Streptomyces sp. AP-93]MCJ0869156.1 hypothetical protein [Streptomyces sp. AP-93]